MNEAFLILSYCDTGEKVSIYNNLVQRLRSDYEGIPIASHAHYPMDTDGVEYFMFDKSNPIGNWKDGSILLWLQPTPLYRLNSIIFNYGYSVINQLKQSLSYLSQIGIDVVYVMNYDIHFSDELISRCKQTMTNHGAYCILHEQNKISTLFFSLNLNEFKENLELLTYDNFIKSPTQSAEGLLFDIISRSGIFTFYENANFDYSNSTFTLSNNIHLGSLSNTHGSSYDYFQSMFRLDECCMFIGRDHIEVNGKVILDDTVSIYVWDLSYDVKVELMVNDTSIFTANVSKEFAYYNGTIPISYDKFCEMVGYYNAGGKFVKNENNDIYVTVNDARLPNHFINLALLSSIQLST